MQHDQDQDFIQVEAAVVDRMRAMRRASESYSEVILRLVDLKASDLK
jgi:predicted CopG family antitoxin